MRQSPNTNAVGHVTAGAGSASLSATSWGAGPPRRRVSSARFFLGAGAFLTQKRQHLPSFSMLRQAFQNGASDAPDAFAAAALAALIDAARSVPRETMDFDIRRRHGTTTTHAPHSSPKVA